MSNIPPAANDFMENADSQSALSVQSLAKSSQYNSMTLSLTQQQWSAVATLSNKKIEDLPEVGPAYLKQLRLKSKLSQQAFAEKLKVHISTVTRWEAEAGDVDLEGEEPANKTEAIASEPLTLLDLIKRQGFTIGSFAETVEKAWAPISGRSLSRDAVSAWINGRVHPRMRPEEIEVILQILDCSLKELIKSLQFIRE